MVRVILDNDRNISHGCVSPDISDKYYEKVHKPEKVSAVFREHTRYETGFEVQTKVF